MPAKFSGIVLYYKLILFGVIKAYYNSIIHLYIVTVTGAVLEMWYETQLTT